jgi:hypothetical protein
MLEVLAIFGLVAILWLVFLFVKFSGFKSKLMNEFGRHGVDFETADIFYAQHPEFVNGLYSSGLSPSKIVAECLRRYPELGV